MSHASVYICVVQLQSARWSGRVIDQFLLHWSSSTLRQYNGQIKKLHEFCRASGVSFPGDETVLASFLCSIADSSARPRGQLNSCLAAFKCMFDALDMVNVLCSGHLTKLVDSLVKSATLSPMLRTDVMPISPFVDMFMGWPDNQSLDIKRLRLKALCLLALVFMLRPSDVAPHARVFDPEKHVVETIVFNANQVQFHDNGDLTITFHGIKNDYTRDGFSVTMPPASVPQVDPNQCLQVYMTRTAATRAAIPSRPVFVSLRKPFHAICSTTVSVILKQAIDMAGLGSHGYSAKCFRPTGATHAVSSGLHPDIARHIGRWRSQEVFEKHYLHSKVPVHYVDTMLH